MGYRILERIETNKNTTKQQEEDYALDMLVCGEILLVKNQWRICLTCTFCGHEVETLKELLTHSLGTHLSDVSSEQIAELLECFDEQKCNLKKQETMHMIEREKEGPAVQIEYDLELPVVEAFPDGDGFEKNFEKFMIDLIDNTDKLPNANEETDGDSEWDITSTISSKSDENSDNAMDFEMVLLDIPENQKTKIKTDFNDNQSVNKEQTQYKKKSDYNRKYECPQCHKVFRRPVNLTAHLNLHEGYKAFACQYCDARFADKANCKVHENRHLGIKPHKCSFCEKAFTTVTELKLHIRSHTGERPCKCDECGKTFSYTALLNIHKRRHTNERPYLCTICGKRFYDGKRLREHQSTHSTERRFACSTCQAAFTSRNALNQHVKLHSEIKQYACKFCQKRFAQCAGLHSHMKTHHSNK